MTPHPHSIAVLLRNARGQLQDISESPALDSELLMAHTIDCNRSYLRAWPERELSADEVDSFSALIARRIQGEPIAYITGEREFWSLHLKVTPATLIPRPDTETLVEQALLRIPPVVPWHIADLGTGSGAIALALAKERPCCQVLASDASRDALTVARDNAAYNGIDNVEFRHGSWFAPLAGERLEMIVSNPPYVRSDDPHLARGDVRFEPQSALVAGVDGLDDLRQIISGATQHLKPGGWLLLEHGYDQGAAVRELLVAQGFITVATCRDHAGQERVSAGQWPLR